MKHISDIAHIFLTYTYLFVLDLQKKHKSLNARQRKTTLFRNGGGKEKRYCWFLLMSVYFFLEQFTSIKDKLNLNCIHR